MRKASSRLLNSVISMVNLPRLLRACWTAARTLLRSLILSMLSPLVLAYHKDWWTVREQGHATAQSIWGRLATACFERHLSLQGSWIGRQATFAGPPCFPHGIRGIFISNEAKIGHNCVLFQHTMIVSTQLLDSKRRGAPVIGDNVYLSCGSMVIGAVKVGEGCRLGTNVVVHTDLSPHQVAVCQAARVIDRGHPMDNRHVSLDAQGNPKFWVDGAWVRASNDELPHR